MKDFIININLLEDLSDRIAKELPSSQLKMFREKIKDDITKFQERLIKETDINSYLFTLTKLINLKIKYLIYSSDLDISQVNIIRHNINDLIIKYKNISQVEGAIDDIKILVDKNLMLLDSKIHFNAADYKLFDDSKIDIENEEKLEHSSSFAYFDEEEQEDIEDPENLEDKKEWSFQLDENEEDKCASLDYKEPESTVRKIKLVRKISDNNYVLGIKNEHTPSDEEKKYEFVNHPSHYNLYPIETIDMMVKIFGPEKTADWAMMTAFKYRMRLGQKPTDDYMQDLKKEKWYLERYNELKNKGDFD